MTPQELENFRLHCRINAVEFVLAAMLTTRSPEARRRFLETLGQLPERVAKASMRALPAEYSDFITAEGQEAAQSLVSFLTSHLTDPRIG